MSRSRAASSPEALGKHTKYLCDSNPATLLKLFVLLWVFLAKFSDFSAAVSNTKCHIKPVLPLQPALERRQGGILTADTKYKTVEPASRGFKSSKIQNIRKFKNRMGKPR